MQFLRRKMAKDDTEAAKLQGCSGGAASTAAAAPANPGSPADAAPRKPRTALGHLHAATDKMRASESAAKPAAKPPVGAPGPL